MKAKKSLSIVLGLLLVMALVSSVSAEDYTDADPGYITGTQIQIDGLWQSRPGLDTFPPASTTLGDFPVQAQLASGSEIVAVGLRHGPPAGEDWSEEPMVETAGQLSGLIPAVDPANFDYCEPDWNYAFYLRGYNDIGEGIENDERQYICPDPPQRA